MSSDDESPADDETFHPLGEAWQDDLEDLLDDTEYDTELGMEMGRDAMRVTRGELSEEAFYERYHDDVMEEFGEDERPVARPDDGDDDEGGMGSMLSQLASGDESRREVLKKGAAGAGFASLGWGAVDQQEPEKSVEGVQGEAKTEEDSVQWGMTIDLENCDGCLACVTACNQEHNWDKGANWMYVLAFEDGEVESPDPGTVDVNPENCGENPAVHEFNYLVRPCQHCTDAPCEKVCPTTARHTRDEGGLVLTDYDVCIGCRYCQVACPYGVNYFQWDEPNVDIEEIDPEAKYDERERWVAGSAPRGVMSKCVFDPPRQDANFGEELVGTTACEVACPPNVIQFGNKNNPASDPQRYKDNPARARTIINLNAELPEPDSVSSSLEGVDGNLDAVINAVDAFTRPLIALATAVQITNVNYEEEAPPGDTLPDKEQDILQIVEAIQGTGLNLGSQQVLSQLGLTVEQFVGPSQDVQVSNREEVAQELFQDYVNAPDNEFELLAEQGTNPNVDYLGHQPGPNAHQVPGPVSYEEVGLLNVRQEALADETVSIRDRDVDLLEEGGGGGGH